METYHLHGKSCCFWLLLTLLALSTCLASFAAAETQYHKFVVQRTPVTRLCRTHNILTVNGQFPGPTIETRNGDSLVIEVVNAGQYNISIHWHGLRQLRNPWADGPGYVTQCPIKPGGSYTYRFTITNQEGTLWWHAHVTFLRATVYGAFIIYPKLGPHYPFPMPKRESTLLLAEWFNRDPMLIYNLAQFTGAQPNVSVAFTINGQPGALYPCSSQDTFIVPIKAGETILLRIINSALDQELFFTIANHQMTVVGTDAAYTKPFTTRLIMIAPGQTINVLVTADQPPGRYYMAARPYQTAMNAAFDNTTTTAILEYDSASCSGRGQPLIPILPPLPAFNDTNTAAAFTAGIRGIIPANALQEVDVNLYFTVGLGLINCTNPNSPRCQGPNGTRFTASMNNVSFVLPSISLMQAYYQGIPGVFTTDFPPVPPLQFNYTGNVPRGLWTPSPGTKLYKLKYGSRVQIVMQDTAIVSTEDHPMHLHGYQFFVVGSGVGNFNPATDPANFNFIDPPLRNTVGTPPGGWVAIRFVADNPGIWFMHCHFDSHLNWGLAMAFLVENGVGPSQSVIPPPADLPPC